MPFRAAPGAKGAIMRHRWTLLLWALLCLAPPARAWAAPAASFTASRASGVAPLAVFFDASASACDGCAGIDNAWHDLSFTWDFADPGAGKWAVSGHKKSIDIGPSAAHVFETPGKYTVKLTVTDPLSGQTAEITQSIEALDPDGAFPGDKTFCYRATDSGDFSGCPAGAQQKTAASFSTAF